MKRAWFFPQEFCSQVSRNDLGEANNVGETAMEMGKKGSNSKYLSEPNE